MSATLPTAAERHRELLEELVDDLFAYMPDAETALVSDAFALLTSKPPRQDIDQDIIDQAVNPPA